MPYKAKRQQSPKRFDVGRLTQDAQLQRQYHIAVQNKFDALSSIDDEDVNISLDSFRSAITDAHRLVARGSASGNRGCRPKHSQSSNRKPTLEAGTIPRNESISNQSSEPKRKPTTRHTSTSLQTNRLGPVFRAIRSLAGQEPPVISKADGSARDSREKETVTLAGTFWGSPEPSSRCTICSTRRGGGCNYSKSGYLYWHADSGRSIPRHLKAAQWPCCWPRRHSTTSPKVHHRPSFYGSTLAVLPGLDLRPRPLWLERWDISCALRGKGS